MTCKIYSEVKGQGHNVVLLHGWGMHGGLWGKFNDLLAKDYQTHALDFPGYGFSRQIKNAFTLDALVEMVEEYIHQLQKPVSLMGWSLGGLVARKILERKNISLDKLVLISTSPSFTKKPDWNCAVAQSVFKEFSSSLALDYKKTLKRFLSLQTRGSDLAREDLRELNKQLTSRGEPDLKALQQGLNILSETDLRSNNKYHIPAMLVLGEKDTLVPLQVKTEFENNFTHHTLLILEKTGHAPFISKPEVCAENIKKFINE